MEKHNLDDEELLRQLIECFGGMPYTNMGKPWKSTVHFLKGSFPCSKGGGDSTGLGIYMAWNWGSQGWLLLGEFGVNGKLHV